MSKFGECLFEFVRDVLKENPNYELQQLNVSAFEVGFDYSIVFEKEYTIQDLGTKLMRDFENIEAPTSDVPVTFIFLLKSKISGGMMSRRYYETLVAGDDAEELNDNSLCDKCLNACCDKARGNKQKEKVEKDSDEDKETFRRMFHELARFMEDRVNGRGCKAHGFIARFPFDEDFQIL